MSIISDAIQAKCLAFSDRIIKLNDYLLKEAANKKHVRAKFHIAKEVSKDDYASWFEDMINKLYLIESQLIIAHATPEKIRERRQQKDVTDILTSLWCEAQRLLKQKKSRYGEMMKTALNYMCNGWADLCNYRNDGHYTIDNMVAERAIRPFTVKRKGSMIFSSEKGVKNAMIFHTYHRDLQAGWYYGQGLSDLCSLRVEPWK